MDLNIKTKNNSGKGLIAKKTKEKSSFFRRKPVRITILVSGLVFVFIATFLAFIYATGSKIFVLPDGESRNPFSKGIAASSILKGVEDDRVNVLVMGIGGINHPGGQLTDSMMLVSLKPKRGSLAMLSIPRDLYVPVADHNISTKLNEVYTLGDKEKKGSGPTLVKKTVSNVLGVPIHYYVTLDFSGFEKFIDEIGGVDVYADKTLYDPYYPDEKMEGYEPFSIKIGQHHLDGKTALKYARSRETTSDFDRSARQQKIAVAAKEKVLRLGFLANPKKVYDLVVVVSDHARTDFSPAEIKDFAKEIKDIESDKMFSAVLASGSDGPLVSDSSSGTYYLVPKAGKNDFSEVAKIAKNIFDSAEAQKEKALIEILNGSKTAGNALKLSDDLKLSDFQIINVGNAGENYEKTVIFDYSGGAKKKTLEALKAKLGVGAVQKTPDEETKAEITIIVGNDYAPAVSGATTKAGEQ